MSNKTSCKGCTERYIGCHSNCNIYKEFVVKNNELKETKRRDNLTQPISSAKSRVPAKIFKEGKKGVYRGGSDKHCNNN